MRKFATPEDEWRSYLEGTHPFVTLGRRTFGRFPSDPRCRICHAPFGPPGGAVFRLLGFRRWDKSPNICTHCVEDFRHHDVMGAEVPVTFLFADIRRSSELARHIGTLELAHLMQRFYATASRVLLEHDAILDKFVGDEAVGFFLPLMTGPEHAAAAIRSAEALLAATGHGGNDDPWVPLGAGVCSGTAFVGMVTSSRGSEFTAFGDPINTAAHLAGQAARGEILVDERGAADAGLDTDSLELRDLSLKGHATAAYVIAV
jgi:adenylate cyclase